MEEIDRRLREILYKVAEDETKRQLIKEKEQPDLLKDLAFDSVAIIEWMVCIEEEFKLSFEESDAVDLIWNFGNLKEWIYTKTKSQ